MLDQGVCENPPTEIIEQIGEELGRLHPKLSFSYGLDGNKNPTLTVRGSRMGLEVREEVEISICLKVPEKRFYLTHGDYTEWSPKACDVSSVLRFVNLAFRSEPEGF